MVDLMMWLVIAALLLAAAIQGIGYYQKAAYLYQMQSDLDGAGTIAAGVAAKEKGVITKAVLEEAVSEAKRSTDVVTTVELASDGKTHYLRGVHPAVTDKDALYLFDACSDTYKIGVNVVPKGGTATLEACGISSDPDENGATTPEEGGTEPVSGGTPSPTDLDGDGIPNTTDPDIDDDGTPNADDTTPNGGGEEPATGGDTGTETGGGGTETGGDTGTVTPVSSKCTPLGVTEEVNCWHDELITAETNYETANGHFFGPGMYTGDAEYPFTPAEMEGTPLKWGVLQTVESWDGGGYNYLETALVDRDGYFWRSSVFHDLFDDAESYSDPLERDINNHNYNYACDFVTPADLNGLCTIVGTDQEKYVATSANSDATAHDDIKKVIDAQLTAAKNGGMYGGYETTTDVTAWAGTTYPTKVWNFQDSSNYYSRVMVIAPNGDLYTSQQRYWKADPQASTYVGNASNAIRSYRYTDEMVERVCTRPFINSYNQTSDIGTCKSLGYADFHA